jgi:NADPH:quinone reductase-like Zn-dependent oxidoreductase
VLFISKDLKTQNTKETRINRKDALDTRHSCISHLNNHQIEMTKEQKNIKIFGQDVEILKSMLANILSYIVSKYFPSHLSKLLPICPVEELDDEIISTDESRTKCISIGRPGGLEQLRVVVLKKGIMTCGYNIKHFCPPPFTPNMDRTNIPSDCVILKNKAFSVNYADCTIRWGLYESAKRFVGYPIVPGFDIAAEIEAIGEDCMKDNNHHGDDDFKVGDYVFGCTLFGAYSNRVLVPKTQLRKSLEQAASLPAVSLTALYALFLAGHFPSSSGCSQYSNQSILIHSAAGGVGSMLVQMSKILELYPIVGVVGSSTKVDVAKKLGCDFVIDKSNENLWEVANQMVPNGFKTIMDANGVSTLKQSYDHLSPTGRLIVFGFHSNLPLGKHLLSPLEWIKMAKKMNQMPSFDPMDLTVENKSVMGFNLSFFADEIEIVGMLFDTIVQWLKEGVLQCPSIQTFEMEEIGKAHTLIQSGSSVGKIVIRC